MPGKEGFLLLFQNSDCSYRGTAAASGDGVGNWIVSGGIGVDNSPLQTVKVLKENLTWVSGPNMPNALRFHCQVFFGTRVFIIGGFGTSGSTSSTLVLEDGEWREDRSPMQTARSHHSCIPFARKIYSIGGLGVDNVLDSVEIYDPDTDLWEAGPALPNPVYEAQAVSYQNTLYLLGGVANAQVFTLSADPGAQWEILEGVMVSEEIRKVFPAPLLTSEMLFCEENI